MSGEGRELSEFERGRIIGAHDAGMSLGEIGKMYDVPKSTVNDIIKAFENHGFTKPQPRSGRPKILNNRDERHLIQMVNKDHKDPIAQITAKMNDATLKDVSVKTIQCTL